MKTPSFTGKGNKLIGQHYVNVYKPRAVPKLRGYYNPKAPRYGAYPIKVGATVATEPSEYERIKRRIAQRNGAL
jgi:hypothetical protein